MGAAQKDESRKNSEARRGGGGGVGGESEGSLLYISLSLLFFFAL